MMLKKFLPRQDFSSYEDFKANYRVTVPPRFNFAYDIVDGWAELDDAKPALAWIDDRQQEISRYSFGDMKRMSNQAANLFKSLGIRKGDTVLLILRQRVEVWVCLLALHKIGAIAIPASFQLKSKDLEYRFQAAEVKLAVIVDNPDVMEAVSSALPACPGVGDVMVVGNQVPAGWRDFRREVAQHSTDWTRPEGDEYPCLHDPMLIYFSSGTSGMPKMVLHDYTYPLGHIVTAKYWQCVEDGGLHLTAVDSGWAKFGWGKIYGQWICGAVIAAYDSEGHFRAEKLLRTMERFRLTTFCAPPTVYRYLVKEDLGKYDFSTIHQCSIAGEPLNPEVYHQWLKKTGLRLVEGFGQTEGSVLIANFPWMDIKPGSTGKFSPIYDLEILDADGRPCEDGIVGTIVVRQAREQRPVGLFREYHLDPAAMAASWGDGDYRTGDMAWRDEDGYIWFVGRDDDVIKSSGYRIGPFEVESALMEHPAVLECAVTAYPDAMRGEVVKATIVLAPDSGFAPGQDLVKELQDHVKRVTAPYKYPRIVEFVESLPKTTSGKIRRNAIRQHDLDNR
ncbi:MAG: Acetyl-coenzyme A synthetase [Lentisphaerae bacterium ADurb.Bin082]|nr:MAG: Acetyl-coenzyme A synthetase [Lentisphaerae bacterium ADurb.Bin082]